MSNRDSRAVARSWTTSKAVADNNADLSKSVAKISAQLNQVRRRVVGGGLPMAGIQWQTPNKELDPRYFVPAGTLVYVSPFNPICATGLFDWTLSTTGGGVLQAAAAGIWLSLQDIPVQVSDPAGYPSGTYYNVPTLPYVQGSESAPSGSPLKGDLDQTVNSKPYPFWVLISQTPVCF